MIPPKLIWQNSNFEFLQSDLRCKKALDINMIKKFASLKFDFFRVLLNFVFRIRRRTNFFLKFWYLYTFSKNDVIRQYENIIVLKDFG